MYSASLLSQPLRFASLEKVSSDRSVPHLPELGPAARREPGSWDLASLGLGPGARAMSGNPTAPATPSFGRGEKGVLSWPWGL